ncbi:DUF1516 family protein [Peribacillus deserti]|uniref:DUF1516 domain-containing protein n=1 Tax=Peribacillus deserti TaxID=673318 RepID=A0A2N5MA80_9BACI|nr:DUF1516 family protein [Peribacillus deserti]PLT31271.1 DUF1516 domain-containing protein [Peribacillus deserti]
MLTGLHHTHASSWAILIILFLISYFMNKQKISLMLQRLFYIVMLGSGIGMLIMGHYPGIYFVKGILAIILIGLMEMLIVRKRKEKKHTILWIPFIIVLAAILGIAYR